MCVCVCVVGGGGRGDSGGRGACPTLLPPAIWSLLRVVLGHYETVSGPSSCCVTDRLLVNKH